MNRDPRDVSFAGGRGIRLCLQLGRQLEGRMEDDEGSRSEGVLLVVVQTDWQDDRSCCARRSEVFGGAVEPRRAVAQVQGLRFVVGRAFREDADERVHRSR